MDRGHQTKKKCKRQEKTINNDSIESNNRTWLICVREGAREGRREIDKNAKTNRNERTGNTSVRRTKTVCVCVRERE